MLGLVVSGLLRLAVCLRLLQRGVAFSSQFVRKSALPSSAAVAVEVVARRRVAAGALLGSVLASIVEVVLANGLGPGRRTLGGRRGWLCSDVVGGLWTLWTLWVGGARAGTRLSGPPIGGGGEQDLLRGGAVEGLGRQQHLVLTTHYVHLQEAVLEDVKGRVLVQSKLMERLQEMVPLRHGAQLKRPLLLHCPKQPDGHVVEGVPRTRVFHDGLSVQLPVREQGDEAVHQRKTLKILDGLNSRHVHLSDLQALKELDELGLRWVPVD